MRANRLRSFVLGPLFSVAVLGAAGSGSQLVEAIKKADHAAVRSALQQHIDVDSAEVDGTTALHWAARLNDLETTELLIRAGASVKVATRYGVTPLSLACANGNAAMIEKLIKAGADPNTSTPEGETALMTASRTGEADAVAVLLGSGAKVEVKENWKGQTALMWASGEGHTLAAKALIEHGAVIQERSKRGFTPLLFAVRNGHMDTVRYLLAAGANVNDAAPDGTSALAMAVINANYELAGLLLEKGADPNAPDPRGSVLHALAFMRRPGSGNPPHQIGDLDSLELAKDLLNHGANPNARIAWKEIKFDRDLGVVKQPPNISIGRNYLSFVGATPFYLAAKHGDVELMRVLAAGGADPLAKTQQNITPLMAAAGIGFWDGESPGPLWGVSEADRVEACKLAIEMGNDVNATANFGDFPIEGDGMSLLLRLPLNLERLPETAWGDVRWSGSTALHGAALTGQNAVVKFLVEKGAKLDAKNRLEWTPLMVGEGVFVANTQKIWPSTVELLKQLMAEHGLKIDAHGGKIAAAEPARALGQQ